MALTRNEKIGIGVGVAAVLGVGGYYLFGKKAAPAAAASGSGGTTASPPASTIEPAYSLAPSVVLHLDQLPVLRPTMGSTAGQTYWIMGDDSAAPFGTAFDAAALPVGNQAAAPPGTPEGTTTTLVSDLGAQMAAHGLDGLVPADVWFVTLGPTEAAGDVGALTQSVRQVRAAAKGQRIVWVLAKSTAPSIAKALNEAGVPASGIPGEEWVRSTSDDPAGMASDAFKAASAPSMDALNAAFPAPPPPPAPPAAPPQH